MDGDYSNQGYLEGSLFRIHTNHPCSFYHTDFINQNEVIEHMETGSGTDPKPEVEVEQVQDFQFWHEAL